MADVQELLDALRNDFRKRCENDRKLKKIADTLEHGTYVDAHDYAVRVGEILSESFAEVLTEDVYSDLTEEMAKQLIPSLLGSGHRMTSNACVSVQTNLNKNAGLGLKPIEPEFDVGRAYDLAEKYVSYDTWKDARWVLGEPVENFMQSVPDDSIRRNADFQWRTGMSPKIIRKAEPGACKWCREVAGAYNYEDVRATGSDVYRRHERCRCLIEYDPKDGNRQLVNNYRGLSNEERQHRIEDYERNLEEERTRALHYGARREFESDHGTIIARHVDKMGYNNLYVSDNITISPRELRYLDHQISLAKSVQGVTNTCNIPIVVVGDSTRLAAYNPRLNVMYISKTLANEEVVIDLQSMFACPNDPRSTMVHELFHWKDAQEYRDSGNSIDSASVTSPYSQYMREYSRKKLIEAGYDLENAEQMVSISRYAYQKWLENDLEEVYTEYRTNELLSGKDL